MPDIHLIDDKSLHMMMEQVLVLDDPGTSTDTAALVVPSKAVLRCFGCGAFGNPSIMRCACQCTYFCNKDCQREAWGRHKQECGPIRSHFQTEKQQRHQQLELARKTMNNSEASSSSTCAVCLEETETAVGSTKTILLPCGHRYCYKCAKEVQYGAFDKGFVGPEKNNCIGLCPLCRQPVPFLDQLVADQVQALVALYKYQPAATKSSPKGEVSDDDGEERDRVLKTALQLLAFVLDQEPGSIIPRQVQAEVFYLLENYNEALEAGKKAYNAFCRPWQEIFRSNGVYKTQQEQKVRKEQAKRQLQEDPGTDFPSHSMEDLHKDIQPIIQWDADNSGFLARNLMVVARAYTKTGNPATALRLLLLVQTIQEPASKQCGGCRPCDVELLQALAECYLALREISQARRLIGRAIQKFRYQPGLHKLLVECEILVGNYDKALFYAAKGYFYEQVWDEQGTRATNLQLWKDLRRDVMVKDQQKQTQGKEENNHNRKDD